MLDRFKDWWNERSVKGKGLTVLFALLFLFIVLSILSGDSSDNNSTNSDYVSKSEVPQVVTINELYAHSVKEGTLVKVTGTVLQAATNFMILTNAEDKDIYITGVDLHAYEDHKVTVTGVFKGPESYTTIDDAPRTVPHISGAKIVN